MTLRQYTRLKGIDRKSVSKEQAFRYGQVSVVALFADYLHLSLSYDNWECAVRKMFRRMT